MEHKGDMHPQVVVEGEKGKESKVYYIHERPT